MSEKKELKCQNENCQNTFESDPAKPSTRQKKYCSDDCKKVGRLSNMKKTMITKYGVDNAMLMPETKEKIKDTNIKKYGVDNPLKVPEIKEKVKNTMFLNYGETHPMYVSDIKEKVKITNIKKYGVDNPSKSTEVKNKKIKTSLLNHGVENPFQSPQIKEKIKDTNIKKYGVPHLSQVHIEPENLIILENYEKLNSLLLEKSTDGIIDFLGITRQTLIKYMKYHEMYEYTKSIFENDVLSFIKKYINTDVILRTRKIIPPKELDILLNEYNLAIECNGLYWHTELAGKGRNYHLDKTNKCQNIGITLLHIYDTDWYGDKSEIVKSRLRNILNISQKIYARKCDVRKLQNRDEIEFFNITHFQGYVRSSICYGLYLDDILVAAMSFGKSRYNRKYEYELLRYSSLLDTTVIGGAGKLFSHFIKNNNPTSVVSYSLRDWGNGNLYRKLGFNFCHNSPPNYFYTKKGTVIESRLKYQKHKLSKLFDNFNPDLSEWENMKNNGYDRLWDSGSSVWEWYPKI